MEYAKKKCLPAQCSNSQNCNACERKIYCNEGRNHSGGWGWFPPSGCSYNFECRYKDSEGNCNYHIN